MLMANRRIETGSAKAEWEPALVAQPNCSPLIDSTAHSCDAAAELAGVLASILVIY